MSKECLGCGVRYYPDELREHLPHCPVLTRDIHIAELEAENRSLKDERNEVLWPRIDELEAKVARLTARGIEDMQFHIAELEALLREARETMGWMNDQTLRRRIDAALGTENAS